MMEQYKNYLLRHYSAPKTIKQYEDCMGRFLKLTDRIDQESVDLYLSRFTNNTLNRSFIKSLCKCFKVSLDTIDLPVMYSREATKLRLFLTIEEIQKMIRELPLDTALKVKLLFETGLRLNEMIEIKRNNIDLDKCTVRGTGKGNVEFMLSFSQETKMALTEYLNRNDGEFPFKYKDVQNHDKKFWYQLKEQCKKIGIPDVHPHRLRHALGYFLRANKVMDIAQVQIVLRHKDISTTAIYSKATEEEAERNKKQAFEWTKV